MWIENPEHQVRFLAEANRMRRTGALCDVVIAVGSRRFYAHKLVLACVSKTLEALFKQPSLRYTLDFLTPLTFEQIMEYAYSGSVEVQPDQVPRLLHASQLLQIDCLVELCLGLHHATVQGLSPEARLVIERGPSAVAPADEEDDEDDDGGGGGAGCNNPNNNGAAATTTIVATATAANSSNNGGVDVNMEEEEEDDDGGSRLHSNDIVAAADDEDDEVDAQRRQQLVVVAHEEEAVTTTTTLHHHHHQHHHHQHHHHQQHHQQQLHHHHQQQQQQQQFVAEFDDEEEDDDDVAGAAVAAGVAGASAAAARLCEEDEDDEEAVREEVIVRYDDTQRVILAEQCVRRLLSATDDVEDEDDAGAGRTESNDVAGDDRGGDGGGGGGACVGDDGGGGAGAGAGADGGDEDPADAVAVVAARKKYSESEVMLAEQCLKLHQAAAEAAETALLVGASEGDGQGGGEPEVRVMYIGTDVAAATNAAAAAAAAGTSGYQLAGRAYAATGRSPVDEPEKQPVLAATTRPAAPPPPLPPPAPAPLPHQQQQQQLSQQQQQQQLLQYTIEKVVPNGGASVQHEAVAVTVLTAHEHAHLVDAGGGKEWPEKRPRLDERYAAPSGEYDKAAGPAGGGWHFGGKAAGATAASAGPHLVAPAEVKFEAACGQYYQSVLEKATMVQQQQQQQQQPALAAAYSASKSIGADGRYTFINHGGLLKTASPAEAAELEARALLAARVDPHRDPPAAPPPPPGAPSAASVLSATSCFSSASSSSSSPSSSSSKPSGAPPHVTASTIKSTGSSTPLPDFSTLVSRRIASKIVSASTHHQHHQHQQQQQQQQQQHHQHQQHQQQHQQQLEQAQQQQQHLHHGGGANLMASRAHEYLLVHAEAQTQQYGTIKQESNGAKPCQLLDSRPDVPLVSSGQSAGAAAAAAAAASAGDYFPAGRDAAAARAAEYGGLLLPKVEGCSGATVVAPPCSQRMNTTDAGLELGVEASDASLDGASLDVANHETFCGSHGGSPASSGGGLDGLDTTGGVPTGGVSFRSTASHGHHHRGSGGVSLASLGGAVVKRERHDDDDDDAAAGAAPAAAAAPGAPGAPGAAGDNSEEEDDGVNSSDGSRGAGTECTERALAVVQAEARLACELCGVRFRDEAALRTHSKSHLRERPHACEVCGKTFTLRHQLKTHHRVHTGEKPFECVLCGQRSRDHSAMTKHLRTHGGAKPYRCTVCRAYCPNMAAMQSHMTSHPATDLPSDWTIEDTYLYRYHVM